MRSQDHTLKKTTNTYHLPVATFSRHHFMLHFDVRILRHTVNPTHQTRLPQICLSFLVCWRTNRLKLYACRRLCTNSIAGALDFGENFLACRVPPIRLRGLVALGQFDHSTSLIKYRNAMNSLQKHITLEKDIRIPQARQHSVLSNET